MLMQLAVANPNAQSQRGKRRARRMLRSIGFPEGELRAWRPLWRSLHLSVGPPSGKVNLKLPARTDLQVGSAHSARRNWPILVGALVGGDNLLLAIAPEIAVIVCEHARRRS